MQNNIEDLSPVFFRKRIFLSILIPLLFVSLLWLIRFIEYQFEVSFYFVGIYPLELKGLPGIILSPLVHEDATHLFNNTIPLIVLGSALFFFYSDISFRVIVYSWLGTGILVWFTGREAWHIGASGIVYSLAAFLFLSGIIRRYIRLLALSLLVAYLYGSMVWGMFPFVDVRVSWEAHMMGAFCGCVLALWYRNEGPENPEPEWLDEDYEDMDAYDNKNYDDQV